MEPYAFIPINITIPRIDCCTSYCSALNLTMWPDSYPRTEIYMIFAAPMNEQQSGVITSEQPHTSVQHQGSLSQNVTKPEPSVQPIGNVVSANLGGQTAREGGSGADTPRQREGGVSGSGFGRAGEEKAAMVAPWQRRYPGYDQHKMSFKDSLVGFNPKHRYIEFLLNKARSGHTPNIKSLLQIASKDFGCCIILMRNDCTKLCRVIISVLLMPSKHICSWTLTVLSARSCR